MVTWQLEGINMSNPWFRLYTEAVDDEKLRLLAFEDRWHFIAILCCKGRGLLDHAGDDIGLIRRKIAIKLGLDVRALDEVARRLAEVGLIDEQTLQPLAWDRRQFISDHDPTRAKRAKKFRKTMKLRSVTDEKRTSNARVTDEERMRNGCVTDAKRISNARRNAPVTDPSRPPDPDTDTDPEKKTGDLVVSVTSPPTCNLPVGGSDLSGVATEAGSEPPARAADGPGAAATEPDVGDDDAERLPGCRPDQKDAPGVLKISDDGKKRAALRQQLQALGVPAERLEPTPNRLRAVA